ncbi:secreted RxLR effector protein 161-like [Brassica napus]|uniref:secreted RxLR effector protein 161-like n=1 Tax=Brassica napus TaxID=3708 RepID=UPI00207958D1|nr:secreted RxLR effector protein 161-like [Brassica napus]
MEANMKISKAEDEREIDTAEFRRIIRCLRYLLHTRPDLCYTVGVLSTYMHNLRNSHGQAIKHILWHVKGATNFSLFFKRDGSKSIVGYSDISHNIDLDAGRTMSGHVFYYGSSLITWMSQKQQTVALSSCEAEFMAAT